MFISSQQARPSSTSFTVRGGPGWNLPCTRFYSKEVVAQIAAPIYSGLRGTEKETWILPGILLG